MDLTKKQTIALDILEDKVTNELMFGGGAGGAKSVLGCHWCVKMCLKYPGVRGLIGRSVLKTLKETTVKSLWWVFRQQGLLQNVHYKYNEQKGLITFTNGSELMLKDLKQYPSDRDFDELGSLEITFAFVDECNQIVHKAWDILKSRIRYRLDEYGLIPKILGTCNPAKNWVYTSFYGPSKRGELEPRKKFVQSLLNDNPHISKHYKEMLLTLDETSKQRLLYGNWEYDDDPSALVTYEAICEMFDNKEWDENGHRFISSDLAMQGRDRFVITTWFGLCGEFVTDKKKSTGPEIEADLRNYINLHSTAYQNVVADSDGLGGFIGGYISGIKEFHGNARANNDVEFQNIKSECAFKLAEMIMKRKVKLRCTPEQKERIIEECGMLKRDDVDQDEKRKRLISKDTMKETLGHSPDYLDALIMRMYFEVKNEVYGYA